MGFKDSYWANGNITILLRGILFYLAQSETPIYTESIKFY